MNKDICCPVFNPAPWDEKEIVWKDELFIKDHVTCLFHIPLNFGSKMVKNVSTMEASSAMPPENEFIVLSGNDTMWGMDLYLKTIKDVPGAHMATISGTFLTKVFEGPYRDTPKWIKAMNEFVNARGKEMKELFTFYTTCPKCAKKYGKNYVVLFARV
jgi:hypothetical protein